MDSSMQQFDANKSILLGDGILRRMQRTDFFKTKFAHQLVVDLAVSGSITLKGLQTFSSHFNPEDESLGSSNLVMSLGTNDFLKNGKFDYANYKKLINTTMAFSIKNVILIKLPPILKKPLLAEEISQANQWIASTASSRGIEIIEAPMDISQDLVYLNRVKIWNQGRVHTDY